MPDQPPPPMTLSAAEASAYLGITPSTLYSYVSRGLVHSEAAPGTRARRYRVADLERLRRRREQRTDPTVVAASALDFGEPVLTSGLCLIEGNQLYYRGFPALELAQQAAFEEVAALLWTGARTTLTAPALPPLWYDQSVRLPAHLQPVDRLLCLLTQLQAQDPIARPAGREATMLTGLHAMQALVYFAGGPSGHSSLAQALTAAWCIDLSYAKIIDCALILLADHELNISSFTARCVASSGASPHLALAAAITALLGPRHGGQSLQVEAFLREVAWDGAPAIAHRLRRGDPIPGFGHALYPDGDPRARLLMIQLEELAGSTPEFATVRTAADAATPILGHAPNVDFALAALVHTLHLPPGASLLIFCLGRLAGWIGHILEQQQMGQLIRPRARYVGPPRK